MVALRRVPGFHFGVFMAIGEPLECGPGCCLGGPSRAALLPPACAPSANAPRPALPRPLRPVAVPAVYSAERLNRLGARHWRAFASQNYFDPQVAAAAGAGGCCAVAMTRVLRKAAAPCHAQRAAWFSGLPQVACAWGQACRHMAGIVTAAPPPATSFPCVQGIFTSALLSAPLLLVMFVILVRPSAACWPWPPLPPGGSARERQRPPAFRTRHCGPTRTSPTLAACAQVNYLFTTCALLVRMKRKELQVKMRQRRRAGAAGGVAAGRRRQLWGGPPSGCWQRCVGCPEHRALPCWLTSPALPGLPRRDRGGSGG